MTSGLVCEASGVEGRKDKPIGVKKKDNRKRLSFSRPWKAGYLTKTYLWVF